VTCEFHSSGIDVDVSVFVDEGRMSSDTLPSAPPSNESWNVISAASLPPRSTSRLPSDAPRSTDALFGFAPPGMTPGVGSHVATVKPLQPVWVFAPRRRSVTGSLKFTRAAFLRKDFLVMAFGFFRTCFRS
jgi:hypothetical protein